MSKGDYKELDVWSESRKLVKIVYLLTQHFPDDEKFGISSQMKRATISIPSNIAEGIGRQTKKETKQFFYISKGSLYELETQLYLAFDLEFIDKNQLNSTLKQLITVRKLIIGFIKFLDR